MGAAVVVLAAVVWTHVQQQAAIDRLDDRIAHLMAGVSLLTDTTEGALRDVAVEIGRLAATTDAGRPETLAASRRPHQRSRTARTIGAGHRGQRAVV
jgi:hypothetical protein